MSHCRRYFFLRQVLRNGSVLKFETDAGRQVEVNARTGFCELYSNWPLWWTEISVKINKGKQQVQILSSFILLYNFHCMETSAFCDMGLWKD